MDGASAEMPRYRCHKEVWALKIADIVLDATTAQRENRDTDGSATLKFEDMSYSPRRVSHDYVRKHNPAAGGYFVVYKDGYESFSPAQAFEEGYTAV